MTIETMRDKLECYCYEVGSCEKCGLSRPDAPTTNSCYSWADDESIITNYNYLVEKRDI